MKKLLLLLLVFPLTANAANMCVKDDALFVVLDPNVAPTSTSYDNDARTWSATFSFGTISGIAGCATASSVGESTSIGAKSSSQSAISLNGMSQTGVMCACKMLLPVESYWINGVYVSGTANGQPCKTYCAQRCANVINASAVTVRSGIFGNVIE